MRGFVAPTDLPWFDFLSGLDRADEVNFWRPSGRDLKALAPGEPLFFKLKSPRNVIGGYGLFARSDPLALWRAWDTFGTANGVPDRDGLLRRVTANRTTPADLGTRLGCLSLVGAQFFPPGQGVEVPSDWHQNIVSGKGYDLDRGEGARLWQRCLDRTPTEERLRYGAPQLIRARLGQGSFQLAVHEAYGNACAVTREHSLPVLEAAHIKPYAQGGAHDVRNGLPLRRDVHRLFDLGYVAVRPDLTFSVSGALREEFDNGLVYYEMDGRGLHVPDQPDLQPDREHLAWHRELVYRGD